MLKDMLNSVQSKMGVRSSAPLRVQTERGKQDRKNVRAEGGGQKAKEKGIEMKCKVAHIHKPPSQKSCFFTHKWLRAQIAKMEGIRLKSGALSEKKVLNLKNNNKNNIHLIGF